MKPFLRKIRRVLLFWTELTLALSALTAAGLVAFVALNRVDKSSREIQSLAQTQLRTSDRTAYWTAGERGPNVVFLHGLLGSKLTFEPLAARLGDRFRLWAYDLKGMGYTPATGDVSLDGQVEQLRRFITELKLAPAAVVGLGYGGGVAQAFAAKYPDLVRQLILVNSVDFLEPNEFHWLGSTHTRNAITAFLRSGYAPQLLPYLSGKVVVRKALVQLYHDPQRITEAAVLGYAYPLLQPGFWDRVPEILMPPAPRWLELIQAAFANPKVPVSAVWGINDAWIYPRQGEKLCARFRACTFYYIEDAGHLPAEEQPDRFAARLAALIL